MGDYGGPGWWVEGSLEVLLEDPNSCTGRRNCSPDLRYTRLKSNMDTQTIIFGIYVRFRCITCKGGESSFTGGL